MGDLLERLRANAEDYTGELQCEAADEIERLRLLLAGRDSFIVDAGLWPAFTETLAARAALKGEK